MTPEGDQWSRLRGLRAYRITEIPRRDVAAANGADGTNGADGPQRPGGADPGRSQRAAAFAAAYHAQEAVAFGWIRTSQGGPVRVVVAGDALAGSATESGGVLLSMPGGAHGVTLMPEELASLLGGLSRWRDIGGISDGLLAAAEQGNGTTSVPPSLESCLLESWTGAFGWMVVAEPISGSELRTLADDTARRLHLAEAAADRFPERALESRRLTARHAELRQGLSSGFWRVHVSVGGTDDASAARVAGLFCASAPLDGLPYTLIPTSSEESCTPFPGSTGLLAALAQPPEAEVPGVRLALRPAFDVTPEQAPGTALTLGEVLDRNLMPAGPFGITLDSLNRHVFVCGATGAGKSQTIRTLLEAATAHGVRWLVVEPAKAEYRLMANRIPDADVITIRPGEADATAAGLNPLEPARAGDATFPLQTHADLVRALFIASFRSEEPFPQVLSAALTRVYEEAGWDLALGEPRGASGTAYPTLGDLQRAAERVVTDIGYSQRVTDDVLGFIRVRIASLRAGTTGRFLEGGHPIDFGRLLRRNIVLEIEDVGDDRDKAFLMGTVLIRLTEHLRLTRGGTSGTSGTSGTAGTVGAGRPGLRHLTVVEEAHRLLRRSEPGNEPGAGTHAVEMFAGLLAEIRAYGEGLIVAEQIPARVIPDVIKNTAVKIVHRLPAKDDRDAVGATMNMTPAQSRFLVTMPPGRAAVFADGMDFPVLVTVNDSTERELLTPPHPHDCACMVTPRSVTCGGECAARPCTLREMRGTRKLLEDSEWLRAWAELTVLAHLSGWPMPVPRPERLAALAGLPPRLTQCAVSHAVDAAVAVRAPAFTGRVNPVALAAHACAAIRAHAERGSADGMCEPGEPGWRLPGPVTEAVVHGVTRPSAIEAAGPLDGLLSDFVGCQWPLSYLALAGTLPPLPGGGEVLDD